VKVLDFGLARIAEPERLDGATLSTVTAGPTLPGLIVGTPRYMSPEQARGAIVDKRADIWAFGCVVFEMLSGTPAFRGQR
jgi:serine/threonine protein kinase